MPQSIGSDRAPVSAVRVRAHTTQAHRGWPVHMLLCTIARRETVLICAAAVCYQQHTTGRSLVWRQQLRPRWASNSKSTTHTYEYVVQGRTDHRSHRPTCMGDAIRPKPIYENKTEVTETPETTHRFEKLRHNTGTKSKVPNPILTRGHVRIPVSDMHIATSTSYNDTKVVTRIS